jgi:WD40 repeat protein
MVAAALAARVVEVISDLGAAAGSRYRYGSGCIVHDKTVLTAAHVVAGAVSVMVRDSGKREYTATVDPQFVGDVDGQGPDLALLEIDDPAFEHALPPIGLAAVDRNSATAEPVERCHAIGYPWFAETPARIAVRDTVDAIGVVPVLSKLAAGLLSVQVTVAPRALPPQEVTLGESEWSGMSGAPVIAGGRLLGVVTEHAPREGPSMITAVPLTALQADPRHEQWGSGVADPATWWSRLGARGFRDLQRLPVPAPPRPPPAYRATLREFGRTLHQRMPQLLGRERELAEITAFATGGEGYRWLVGGAFTGKTALVYEVATVGQPDEVDVVSYFLSRRASDASGDRFLAAVVPQLAYLCGVDPPAADVDQYRALWEQAADRAAQSKRHLLLVVDGLDEDLRPPRSPSVASLLPTLVGAHAHVLVASRPRPELPEKVPDGHPLRAAPATDLDPFEGAQQLAELVRHEIHDLTNGADADLAVDVLGLLTAAAGPLSVVDLVALRSGQSAPTSTDTLRVRRLVEERVARSLERVGPAGHERYQFVHGSMLEYAQKAQDLRDPGYRQRIHQWAERWQAAGWPSPDDSGKGTPRYLLDTYSSTLARDPQRLAALVVDAGWIEVAIQSVGVDRVLGDLRRAAAADPASAPVKTMFAIVASQAYNLRWAPPPDYVLRQLCMQAAELSEDVLAADFRGRLQARPGPGLVPLWTTSRASRAQAAELSSFVQTPKLAVLPGGQVVIGGGDRRVLIWDPAAPGADPVEIGRHENAELGWDRNYLGAVAVLPGGQVVTSGGDGRVLIWDPATPGVPSELGRQESWVQAAAVLPGGQVVTGGGDGRVLMWDPATPGVPTELGRLESWVRAVAILPGGQVVTGGGDGRVLVWDPAAPGVPAELGRHDGAVEAVAVLPGGQVVTGGNNERVLIWDPTAPGADPAEMGRYDYGVTAIGVLPGGQVVTGGNDGRVLIWDLAAPGVPAELGRHHGAVQAVVALPGRQVITGGEDGQVLVWDMPAPGRGRTRLDNHARVRAVAVLPSGQVVTGGNDGCVLVWDAAVPGVPAELGRHRGAVRAVAVLPGGQVVTGGNDGCVLVWDAAVPGVPAELGRHRGAVQAVAVLPGGQVVTGGEDGLVLMWDPIVSGRARRSLLRRGRRVTGSIGRSAAAVPAELGRHYGAVRAVAVLPGGQVVTGGEDGLVLMWDRTDPSVGPTLLGHHNWPVVAVAVLPGSRVLTCSGVQGSILVSDPTVPSDDRSTIGVGWADAMVVLPSGHVVTSGGNSVVIRDPASPSTDLVRLNCLVTVLATAPLEPGMSCLVIVHGATGFSTWSVKV